MNRRALLSGSAAVAAMAALPRDVLGASLPPVSKPAQIGAEPSWRAVSNLASYPYVKNAGATPTFMSRMRDTIVARAPVEAVRVGFCNFNGVSAGNTTEGDGSNTITITASLEVHQSQVAGTWSINTSSIYLMPLFFGGNRSITLSPGASVLSDPLFYPLQAGQTVYIRTYASASGGKFLPCIRNPMDSTEGSTDSYFTGATVSASSTPATTITGTVTTGSNPVTLPLVPGTLQLSGGTISGLVTDDGAGNFPSGSGLAAGSTVNYTTGAVSLNFTASTVPSAIRVNGYGNNGVTPADNTLTVGSFSNWASITSDPLYGHSAIFGLVPQANRPLGILALGDSIDYGSGNSTDNGQSWVNYCAAGQIGVIKCAQPSEKASDVATFTNLRRRLSFARGMFDRVIENYATNDMFNTSLALATLQANKLALWAMLAKLLPNGAAGIYVATVLPRTLSAASQSPFNTNYGPGTVASGSPSLRNAYNAWLFTQIGVTIGGVIDTAAAVENAPASQAGAGDGQWKSLSNTFDGTHPSYSGYQAIGALVGYGGTSPSPAFSI